LFTNVSAFTLFAGSMALYYQTTYRLHPQSSKLSLLPLALLSALVSRAYARTLFETPLQTAAHKNNTMEWRH